MKNKSSLTEIEIEQLNQDLADDGIIYDLDISSIDVLSLDDEIMEKNENGEAERS